MNQLNIDFSRQARDAGMMRAVTHADEAHENWSDKVFAHLRTFLSVHSGDFACEEFRAYVEGLVPQPVSLRAYGAIIVKAAKAGLITKVGYTQVKNVKAHCANSAVWRRA